MAFEQVPYAECPPPTPGIFPAMRDLTGELVALSGIQSWIDAEHVITTPSKISQATSICAGGKNFVQNTDANRPTLVENVINGRPAFDFVASRRLDLVGGFPSSGDWTYYLLFRLNYQVKTLWASYPKGFTAFTVTDATGVAIGQYAIWKGLPVGAKVINVVGNIVYLDAALLRDIDIGDTIEFVTLPGATTYLMGATTPGTSAHYLYLNSSNKLSFVVESGPLINDLADLTGWLLVAASWNAGTSTAKMQIGPDRQISGVMTAAAAFETNTYLGSDDGVTAGLTGHIACHGFFSVDHFDGAHDADAQVVRDYLAAAYRV